MGTISEFYSGKTVLVTGGTGFMGKVLIEKLLRSCPNIAKVYALIRPKNDTTVKERRNKLLSLPIFDWLKEMMPHQLDKFEAISGDVVQPGLNLSQRDEHILEEEVNVIFHMAASISFMDNLKTSIKMNVVGTREVMQVAKHMPNLEAFVHVSTAYCNCNRDVIEEHVYPTVSSLEEVMAAVNKLDADALERIAPILLDGRPNNYTFSKALAENMVIAERDRLPMVIVRPSIVSCAWKEPIPGWVDGVNFTTGFIAGFGKGIMRTMLCDPNVVADVVPVDVPINLMIAAAWEVATRRPDNVPVFNCTTGAVNPLTWGKVKEWGMDELFSYPISKVAWYPNTTLTTSPLVNTFWTSVVHFLPGIFVDLTLKLLGKKPLLIRIYKKMWNVTHRLCFFTLNQWRFRCDNVLSLWESMSAKDQHDFHFDIRDIDWREYISIYCAGVRRFTLKEDRDYTADRRQVRFMWVLDKVVRLLQLLLFLRVLARFSPTLWTTWRAGVLLLQKLWLVMAAPMKRLTT